MKYNKDKNYCTNFIRNIGKCDWNFCCFSHDLCYGKSGITRIMCDKLFRKCVNGRKCFFSYILAPIMWTAVRLFGNRYYEKRRRMALIKEIRRLRELNKKLS